MTTKGITFSTPLVQALLAGEKRQTRRIVMRADEIAQGPWTRARRHELAGWQVGVERFNSWRSIKVPFEIGDQLYVRETVERANGEAVGYRADGTWLPNTPWRWKVRVLSGRYMPRELSRLWLDVTDVRLQRLQDISDADIWDECEIDKWAAAWLDEKYGKGEGGKFRSIRSAFETLWDGLHNRDGERWADNPWIVALSFDVQKGNVDD